MKPLALRAVARRDIDAAIDYYRREAGEEIALGFIDALEKTFRSILHRPATGSPSLGNDLGLAGLRSKQLARFPYLIFYVEQPNQIEIWRVLHTRRDIPASLAIFGG